MVEDAAECAEEMGLKPYYLYRQKILRGILRMLAMQRLTKPEFTIYLLWKKNNLFIAAGAGASTKIVLKDPIPMPGSKKKKMTRLIRQENVKAVDAYIDRIDEMIERKGEWLWR